METRTSWCTCLASPLVQQRRRRLLLLLLLLLLGQLPLLRMLLLLVERLLTQSRLLFQSQLLQLPLHFVQLQVDVHGRGAVSCGGVRAKLSRQLLPLHERRASGSGGDARPDRRPRRPLLPGRSRAPQWRRHGGLLPRCTRCVSSSLLMAHPRVCMRTWCCVKVAAVRSRCCCASCAA